MPQIRIRNHSGESQIGLLCQAATTRSCSCFPYEQNGCNRLNQAGQIIHAIHDLSGNRIAEYLYDDVAGTSSLIREYVWMDDRAVAVVEGGVIYYVRTAHIGRPLFATDSLGTKVWEVSYLPFGGVTVTSGTPINLRFPGQWFQSESGLHQNWMRDYDPSTGRYLQADPLGLVPGTGRYECARCTGPTPPASALDRFPPIGDKPPASCRSASATLLILTLSVWREIAFVVWSRGPHPPIRVKTYGRCFILSGSWSISVPERMTGGRSRGDADDDD